MEVDHVGVHASHCCTKHGCKYNDSECPVEQGEVTQDHPCETCEWADTEIARWLHEATNQQIAAELVRRGEHHAAANL